jgi:hypothetical protein
VLNRRLASRKPPLDYPVGSLLILPAVVTRRLLASKRKAAGKEITAPKRAEPSNVINLMDALKRSVAAERGEKHSATGEKAPSARKASSAKRARKSVKKARKAG